MKDRKEAMKWWNSLSEDDKIWIMMKAGYETRHASRLTGREIEDLWTMEVEEDNATDIESPLKNIGTQRSPFGIGS